MMKNNLSSSFVDRLIQRGYVACLFIIVAGVALFCVLTGATEAKAFSGYEHDLDEKTRVPRLVGYGCKGASGPLYANEEDHFPAPCDAVEAWR